MSGANNLFNKKSESFFTTAKRRSRSTFCTKRTTNQSGKDEIIEKCHCTESPRTPHSNKVINCGLSCREKECFIEVKECLKDNDAEMNFPACKKRTRSNLVRTIRNKFLSFAKMEKNNFKNCSSNCNFDRNDGTHPNNTHQSLPKSWKMIRKSNVQHRMRDESDSRKNYLTSKISHQIEICNHNNEDICEGVYFKNPSPDLDNNFSQTLNIQNNNLPRCKKPEKLENISNALYSNTSDQRTEPACSKNVSTKQKRPSCLKSFKASPASACPNYEPSGYGHVSPPDVASQEFIDCLSLDSIELGTNDRRSIQRKRIVESRSNSSHCSKTKMANDNRNNTVILPYYDEVKQPSTPGWSLTNELMKLSSYGWYWGPLSKKAAEAKLAKMPDGCFLIRDSSDDRYLLSLSFRSNGQTLHTRIEHYNGMFSFYAKNAPTITLDVDDSPDSPNSNSGISESNVSDISCKSVIELIERSIVDSKQNGVFCYSRISTLANSGTFPVCLSRPISRFSQISTLQHMCRFVLRQKVRLDHIQSLPLPRSIKLWLLEAPY